MNPDKGEAVAKDVKGVFAQADVADADQVIAAVEAAKEMGPLRALVTAAGIGMATRTVGRGGYDTAHSLDIFKKVLEVNLVGTFNCVRLAATAMAQTEAARRRRARRDRQPWRRSPPSTARSARPPTRPPRAAWSA